MLSVVYCHKYCAVCDVTFTVLEQYIKATDEQEKWDMPVKKDKMPKEDSLKTPSQTIKKISKISPTKLKHENVVLKPFETPEKSKVAPIKKKQITTAKKIEEVVTLKSMVVEGEHKKPEIHINANRIPTEKNEDKKSSYRPSKDQESSEKDEKPGKEDKLKIQVKKADKTEEVKSLMIKKERCILKEREDKEDILLKPVECIKKDSEHEKFSPKVVNSKEEKPSVTIVTKEKESPKEEGKTSVCKKSGSLPGKMVEEEKISLKPVGPVEAEMKKTLSPKAEPIPLQRKSSATVPKKDITKDLSSQQKKASHEQTEIEKMPLIKELSPGAVQLEKIPTQQEEEVFEEEFGEEKEEEETWGWEVVPSECYEAEEFDTTLEDGAIEAAGGSDDKIGEREPKT